MSCPTNQLLSNLQLYEQHQAVSRGEVGGGGGGGFLALANFLKAVNVKTPWEHLLMFINSKFES